MGHIAFIVIFLSKGDTWNLQPNVYHKTYRFNRDIKVKNSLPKRLGIHFPLLTAEIIFCGNQNMISSLMTVSYKIYGRLKPSILCNDAIYMKNYFLSSFSKLYASAKYSSRPCIYK